MTAAAKGAAKTTQKATKRSPKKTAGSQAAVVEFPYAVIRTGGKQYRVAKGDMLLVEKLELEPGATWSTNDVLFVATAPGAFQIGRPTVKGAKVSAEVLQQTLGKKVLVRHHRRRQNSQKTLGHRQPQSRVLIKDISF